MTEAITDPKTFIPLGKILWLIIICAGLSLEIYAQWFNPKFCTFTGLVKEYSTPLERAAGIGVLGYHFVIQPIYEAFKALGIKSF